MKAKSIGTAAIVAASLAFLTAGSAHAAECTRERGFTVVNQVVYFDVDSTEIASADQEMLTKLFDQFKGNPSLSVCFLGQADVTGPQAYNEELALRRANAVADFMKLQGVEPNKLQVVSRGQAVNDGSFVARIFSGGFKSDRRVEILMMTP